MRGGCDHAGLQGAGNTSTRPPLRRHAVHILVLDATEDGAMARDGDHVTVANTHEHEDAPTGAALLGAR